MMHTLFRPAPPLLSLALVLGLVAPAKSHAATPGRSDFGDTGLMQIPTARMPPLGHAALTLSRTAPYRRYNLFFQPTNWLEAGFRYVEIENRQYLAADEDRNNLDKGLDFKLRLLEETRFRPQLAVGVRDLAGTGLFGAEYLVASKRWHDLDVTLGLGWGYLGNQSDFANPLGRVFDRFETRGGFQSGGDGGSVSVSRLFSGSTALFGGIEYQTPWEPLALQLEFEGNDYQQEPQRNDQVHDSRFNFGARLRLTDNIELQAGWERGNTAMLGVSFAANLATLSQAKRDPRPARLTTPPTEPDGDWQGLNRALKDNAGIRVHRLRQAGDEVTVEGEPIRYPSLAESELRAGRLLHNRLGREVETFRFRWQQRGMPLRESVHDRQALTDAVRSAAHRVDHRHGIYAHGALTPARGKVLFENNPRGLSYSLGPMLEQNFGGPDGYLYRISANLDAEYRSSENGWVSGSVAYGLADNLENYDYIADSDLPRVRTHIGDYLAETELGLTNLQYTHTARVADDWYAMGYGGVLETMYAGVGGEVLYRPFDSDLAIGLDLNWVRQRAFDQGFGLRDYSTWTGHLSGYWQTGIEDTLAKVSVGRYLAGDLGATFDLSREFASGVRLGGWATFTDAGSDYGEGSFDKGIYVSLPLNAFFVNSTRQRANIAWQPLTRDGGARLGRRFGLYGLTRERDMARYWEDYDAALP
ncbi:YjbH domain-containing protein [Halomonas nitroreducens]|nr:YjbH domain-containing protein [Halomonas nitroreducens]